MKRLTRSMTNKIIFGVCGGIAEYFDFDATIIRLLTAIGGILIPGGILCYIVSAIIMPKE